MMIALTVRQPWAWLIIHGGKDIENVNDQPWAWLIIHGGKDIENRNWFSRWRGRFYVHAGLGCTRQEYLDVVEFLRVRGIKIDLPPLEALPRGGLVGSVDLVNCVSQSNSPWFIGPKGFELRKPEPMQFIPMKGRLGFFEVHDKYLIVQKSPEPFIMAKASQQKELALEEREEFSLTA